MSTKHAAMAITVMVYCLSLWAFPQHRAHESLNYDRPAGVSAEWDLSGYVGGLNSAADQGRWQVMRAAPAAHSASPTFDPFLARTIREYNGVLPSHEVERLARLIEGTANMYGVDPYLVTALVSQESGFRQSAVSPVGALGLGQLMPQTAKELGVNPHDDQENLEGCVRYLAQNLEAWAGSSDPVALALASYNAGPGAVERYQGIPPYQETQHYVWVVKARYDRLCSNRSPV